MIINEVFAEMAGDLAKLGVHVAQDPGITVNEILEIGNDLELDEIEELLTLLTSYNIFLKSQKGSYSAQLTIKQGELKRRLYLETQNMPKQSDNGTYLTKEEKESMVLSSKLNQLHHDVLRLRALFDRIKDIPYAIDKKIDLLKMKYRRLLDADKH